ncbi:MAG: DinB family protein [Thermomicrobia bacterium]|nr:DinB family protein [Thermomicrobia bacterium]
MSERAARLAEAFEEVNGEVVALAEQCSAAEWRQITDAEQWQVGVVCRHIARSLEVYPAIIRRLVSGEPPPTQYNWDDIHRSNAEQAKEWADGSKEETSKLLHVHSAALAQTIRPLTDAQLDHSSVSPLTGKQLTTAQFIEGMIEHVRIHLASARATVSWHTEAR